MNWWNLDLMSVFKFLLMVRVQLFADLKDTSVGQTFPQIKCPFSSELYRTHDGTCNTPNNPHAGKVGTRFARMGPYNLSTPETTTLMTPNPIDVSRKLLHRVNGTFIPVQSANLLAAAWIQ